MDARLLKYYFKQQAIIGVCFIEPLLPYSIQVHEAAEGLITFLPKGLTEEEEQIKSDSIGYVSRTFNISNW